ncbi:hypothetical protein [Phreatobacter oligotrophus]|uniref:Uncharacterized protein n=1 Tax=Phreatobacter oligotrophus TaxID=1122261 RepID=A0A2T4YYL5_9HYPH|nr:hypothetical protein [Phreatobacter oligotrophus]PTM51812.1 hypothetical protein C8P69_10999 [Phreatobacter oligotrophus]
MAVGSIGTAGTGTTGAAGDRAGGSNASAVRPAETAPKTRVANVTVTLSPEARQHLSRLEGFTATIGTSKQPKQMTKPGINIDFRT